MGSFLVTIELLFRRESLYTHYMNELVVTNYCFVTPIYPVTRAREQNALTSL